MNKYTAILREHYLTRTEQLQGVVCVYVYVCVCVGRFREVCCDTRHHAGMDDRDWKRLDLPVVIEEVRA